MPEGDPPINETRPTSRTSDLAYVLGGEFGDLRLLALRDGEQRRAGELNLLVGHCELIDAISGVVPADVEEWRPSPGRAYQYESARAYLLATLPLTRSEVELVVSSGTRWAVGTPPLGTTVDEALGAILDRYQAWLGADDAQVVRDRIAIALRLVGAAIDGHVVDLNSLDPGSTRADNA